MVGNISMDRCEQLELPSLRRDKSVMNKAVQLKRKAGRLPMSILMTVSYEDTSNGNN